MQLVSERGDLDHAYTVACEFDDDVTEPAARRQKCQAAIERRRGEPSKPQVNDHVGLFELGHQIAAAGEHRRENEERRERCGRHADLASKMHTTEAVMRNAQNQACFERAAHDRFIESNMNV